MNGAVALPLDAPDLTIDSAGDVLVRRTILPSGLRVLSERVPGARSVSVGFWVPVGSRDEHGPDGSLPASFGSTHFLEHLLFKGTPHRSALDIARAFDAVGGEHNAMTAKEYTCYYAKVQDRDLKMSVEVMTDMLAESLLDATEFENERGVILDELAMAEDDAADRTHELLAELVFGEGPLGRPIGGTYDTIRAAGRDAVYSHYRNQYVPSQLVVTVAGAVEHEQLVEWVVAAFARTGWDLAASAQPVSRRPASAAPSVLVPQTRVLQRPTEQVTLAVGTPGILAGDDRRMTLAVLNSVLGGGMSSRLFQEVREKRGLAYSVYSFASSYSDAGLFGMFAGCAPENAREVASLLQENLDLIASDGIGDEELALAVGSLSGAGALALENSDTRMSRLGRAEITLGEYADLDANLERLALVTAEGVRELAAELAASPSVTVAVGNVDDELGALQGR